MFGYNHCEHVLTEFIYNLHEYIYSHRRNKNKLRLFKGCKRERMHIVHRHEMIASFTLWVGRGCKSCAVSDVLEDFHVYSKLIDLYGWIYSLEALSFHNNQQMLNGYIGCSTCDPFSTLFLPCCPVGISPNSPWTRHVPQEYRHINTIPQRLTNGNSKPPDAISWHLWPKLAVKTHLDPLHHFFCGH